MSAEPEFALFVGAGDVGTTHYVDSPEFTDFTAGQPLFLSYKLKANRVSGSANCTIHVELQWWDSAGTQLATTAAPDVIVNATLATTLQRAKLTPPAGAVKGVCRVQITPVASPMQHDVWITKLRLGKTELFATYGATWGQDVSNVPANLAALVGTEVINNKAILDSIASDNVLSVAEKLSSLKKLYADLDARYWNLVNRANALGVSTTALTTARTNWTSLLGTYDPAWNDTTRDTVFLSNLLAAVAFPGAWGGVGTGSNTPNGVYTTLTDSDAANVFYYQRGNVATFTGVQTYSVGWIVKKDATPNTTRAPAFYVFTGGGALKSGVMAIDTSTGALVGSSFPASGVLDLGEEWFVYAEFTSNADNTSINLRVYPAYCTTNIFAASNALTGSIDVRAPIVVQGPSTGLGRPMLLGRFNAYAAQLTALAKAISEKDATLATWTGTSSRPANLAALAGTEGIKNGDVSIGSNGALVGGGGGQVTIAGLGFLGSLRATRNADGANMIPSPVDLDQSSYANGAAFNDATGSGSGRAVSFGKRATFPQNTSAEPTWYPESGANTIPCQSGETLYWSYAVAKSGTGTTDRLTAVFDFFAANGSAAGTVFPLNASITGSAITAAGGVALHTGTVVVPAGSAYVRPRLKRDLNTETGTFIASEPYLGRHQQGATYGASWLNNLLDRPGNLSTLIGSEGILNNLLQIGSNGALIGGGGGQVTIGGLTPNGLDDVADGGTYGRIKKSELLSGAHKLTIGSSGMTIGDQRNLPVVAGAGLRYKFTGAITYTVTSTTAATINVAAGSILLGSQTISYNPMSVNVTGTAGNTFVYYLYVATNAYTAGAHTLIATTNPQTPYSDDNFAYIGDVTLTYTSGSSGGGTGGGGTCIVEGEYVLTRRGWLLAQHVVSGDCVRVLTEDGEGYEWIDVESNDRGFEISYRLTGEESGISVCVSQSSPITALIDGEIGVTDLDGINGCPLPFYSDERHWWECVKIEPVGIKPVRKIRCHGRTYVGGSIPGCGIATHNPKP